MKRSLSRIEQKREEQNRTEQNRIEQNRTEQNRTEQKEQNRTEQNRTEQNRTEQNRTEKKRKEKKRKETNKQIQEELRKDKGHPRRNFFEDGVVFIALVCRTKFQARNGNETLRILLLIIGRCFLHTVAHWNKNSIYTTLRLHPGHGLPALSSCSEQGVHIAKGTSSAECACFQVLAANQARPR